MFLETDGSVCIDAQTALEDSEYAYVKDGQTHKWSLNGARNGLQASPNRGDIWDGNDVDYLNEVAPSMSFQIDFSTPGVYYMYTLISHPDGSSDSMHVALDGEYQFNTNNSKSGSLVWDKYPSSWNFEITTPGVHTLTIWAREDGCVLNKIYLTNDPTDPLPTGMGPMESPREEIETLIHVKEVTIKGTTPSIEIDETTVLTGTVRPAEANDTTATWSLVSGEDCVNMEELDDGRVSITGLAEGEAVIRLTSNQDPEVFAEYTLTVVGEDWTPGAFLEVDGRVCLDVTSVMEQSEYANYTDQGEFVWSEQDVNDQPAMVLSSNNNMQWKETELENVPSLSFQVYFQDPGTYYLYTFTSHPDDSSDSFFVGLDGEFLFDTNNNTGHSGKLKWQRNNSIWRMEVEEAGVHTITFWAREDGVVAHKFYLSQNGTEDMPTGTGPEVSNRVKLAAAQIDGNMMELIPLLPAEPVPEDPESEQPQLPQEPDQSDVTGLPEQPETTEPPEETLFPEESGENVDL